MELNKAAIQETIDNSTTTTTTTTTNNNNNNNKGLVRIDSPLNQRS